MTITIDEQHLLALLRECLPVLEFAVGGCEDVTAKVRFVLELARQNPNPVESDEAALAEGE